MCVAIVFHLMHIVLAVQGIRLAIAVLAYVLSRDKSNQDWSCEVAGVCVYVECVSVCMCVCACVSVNVRTHDVLPYSQPLLSRSLFV